MTTATLDIPLHDGSVIRVAKTDTGAIWMELLAPMTLKDGHGIAVKGSALLTEEAISAMRDLLTSPAERKGA